MAALLADAAAGNVIHHNAVAYGESPTTRTDRHHLTARLMPSDDTPVRLWSTTQMLPIDGADITAADRRGLHLQQHLAMSRLWDIHLNVLDGAVAGKDDSVHRCHDVSSWIRLRTARMSKPHHADLSESEHQIWCSDSDKSVREPRLRNLPRVP